MTVLALTLALAAAIALPHLLRLAGADPATAAALWAANLAIRALAGVFVAVYLVLSLPGTQVFGALTHWCWHTVLPLLATHLGLDGHRMGDVATLLPLVVLMLSVFWVGAGVFRVARSVRRLVKRSSLGTGPQDSLIVGGPEVMVAAAGLARPKVLVSAGALAQLDDEELAAGLDHERGHIARRHRWVLVYAELCRALAVFLPGTRAAVAQLSLHLERDADRWAVSQRNDRLALALAIVKAATGAGRPSTAFAALGGHADQLTPRVRDLVEAEAGGRRPQRRVARAAAVVTCLVAIGFALAAPSALAASQAQAVAMAERHCVG